MSRIRRIAAVLGIAVVASGCGIDRQEWSLATGAYSLGAHDDARVMKIQGVDLPQAVRVVKAGLREAGLDVGATERAEGRRLIRATVPSGEGGVLVAVEAGLDDAVYYALNVWRTASLVEISEKRLHKAIRAALEARRVDAERPPSGAEPI